MVPPPSQPSPSPNERSEEECSSFDAFVLLSTMDSAMGGLLQPVACYWMERHTIIAALTFAISAAVVTRISAVEED